MHQVKGKSVFNPRAPIYIPAPKAYHKPPIIIYQGVAPPVHVYEKPAGSSGGAPSYAPVAKARSDTVAPVPASKPVPAAKKALDDLVPSADTSNQWSTVTAAKAKVQDPIQPRIDNKVVEEGAAFDSAVVSASVAVGKDGSSSGRSGSPAVKETLTRKGTVEDITTD